MKKITILPLFLLLVLEVFAQNSAKKYVLLEHFTNSRCSVCASRNPAFYTLIGQAQYADNIHHISIHPPFPYVNCVFYQANTSDNSAWADLYDIPGTPRVVLNGRLQPASSQLLRQDTLDKHINLSSPMQVKVTLSGSGSARTATIETKTLGALPAGNYRLYVAVAEKTINMTTPNGESVHHDVFRDMLTPVAGEDILPAAPGQSVVNSYNFNLAANWNASEIYVLAFVKNESTMDVLNSGTNLDLLTLSNQDIPTQRLLLAPNPAQTATYAYLQADERLQSAFVTAIDGRVQNLALDALGNKVEIPLEQLTKGMYFVHIQTDKTAYTGKLLVQ